jgi:hypothetical protein
MLNYQFVGKFKAEVLPNWSKPRVQKPEFGNCPLKRTS